MGTQKNERRYAREFRVSITEYCFSSHRKTAFAFILRNHETLYAEILPFFPLESIVFEHRRGTVCSIDYLIVRFFKESNVIIISAPFVSNFVFQTSNETSHILFALDFLSTGLNLQNLLGMRAYQIDHWNAVYKPQLCFPGMYIISCLLTQFNVY